MTVLSAVVRILTDASEPLHYTEITTRMIDSGLWTPKGATPAATVNSTIAKDIKYRGSVTPFVRTAAGVFGLRASANGEALILPIDNSEVQEYIEKFPALTEAKVTLSFTDAAERVLDSFGKRKPMHYREITEQALTLGLVATKGKTPEATMYSQILIENGRRTKRGEPPRFIKHGKGLVGLAKWQGRGLVEQIDAHNATIRKRLRSRLLGMNPDEFESLIGKLLGVLGFADVQVTARSNDGGIDVRGTLVVGDVIRTRMAVQVKRWKGNIPSPTIQQVRGSLGAHDQGLIITTSDFSKGARSEAAQTDKTPVALMNGEQLVALLTEHNILVRRSSHDLIELSETEEEDE